MCNTPYLAYHTPHDVPPGWYSKSPTTTRFITRATLYTTPPEVMPRDEYDTPRLSPSGESVTYDAVNKTRTLYITAAEYHRLCESTTAYGDQQHGGGGVTLVEAWPIPADQTSLRLRQLLDSRLDYASLPPRAMSVPQQSPSTSQPTTSAAQARTTVPVPADVPAMALDAEGLTTALVVCGRPACEKQLCIADPGQTIPTYTRDYHLPTCLECGSRFFCGHCYHPPHPSSSCPVYHTGGICAKIPNYPLGRVVYHTPYTVYHPGGTFLKTRLKNVAGGVLHTVMCGAHTYCCGCCCIP